MNRTDCNGLVKLLLLAAPFLFAACTQRDSAHAETATIDEPPITVAPLPEVLVTASRLDSDEEPDEDERRVVARRER